MFDPATWKTEYPNPSFNQMDAADAFWAASIVSRFSDQMIRGIVEEARLSDRDAAEYLADVIIKRRDKTVRWGITSTNPLDRFEVRDGRAPELAFDNAAARLHIVNQHIAVPRSAGRRSTTPSEPPARFGQPSTRLNHACLFRLTLGDRRTPSGSATPSP